ncbi:MAG: transposase [Solirubrobacteraceae bacterium]
MQQALEDEVTEFLGRERYARAGEGAAIYRNGYEPRTVRTTSGAMELERPRIRGAAELGFESQCSARAWRARTRRRR